MDNIEKHLISPENQKQFMLAGKSRFSICNNKSGVRMSFKVTKRKKKENEQHKDDMYFVSVDTNLENRSLIKSHFQYNYLGVIINGKYFYGKKSKLGETSLYNKSFTWLFKKIMSGTMPQQMEFFHNNHCARCGKSLRIPESIISGFGPECSQLMKLK